MPSFGGSYWRHGLCSLGPNACSPQWGRHAGGPLCLLRGTQPPFTRVEGLFPVLLCPGCLAKRARGRGPYPDLSDEEMRAGLDLLPTWVLEQKAAANRQGIAVMRQRLARGEPVVPMYGPLGLAWLGRQADIAEQLIRAAGSHPPLRRQPAASHPSCDQPPGVRSDHALARPAPPGRDLTTKPTSRLTTATPAAPRPVAASAHPPASCFWLLVRSEPARPARPAVWSQPASIPGDDSRPQLHLPADQQLSPRGRRRSTPGDLSSMPYQHGAQGGRQPRSERSWTGPARPARPG
jgi:hypothetical protein